MASRRKPLKPESGTQEVVNSEDGEMALNSGDPKFWPSEEML